MTAEVKPDWSNKVPPERGGVHVFHLKITSCEFKRSLSEKSYMNLGAVIVEGEHAGFEFWWRLYFNKQAESWTKYGLKKLGYPLDLLDTAQPRLISEKIVGLEGKVQIRIRVGNDDLLQFSAEGFERLTENELEDRLEKKKNQAQLFGDGTDEAVIDLEADVKEGAQVDFGFLD